MEAPEKVYLSQIENGTHYYTEEIPFERDYIEYVRKDSFVQKALKFSDENFFFDKRRYSIESGVFDSKEEMFEDFKKNMEVQEQNLTWSEKDEKLLELSLENLTELKNRFGEEYGKVGDCIYWLKSLKDRIK